MKRKLFWMTPVFNGIVVGLILWAMNDFDVTRVLGQWAIIAVVLSVYASSSPAFPRWSREWLPNRR